MKKLIYIITFIFIFLLISCSADKNVSYSNYKEGCNIESLDDTYAFEFDSQYYFEETHSLAFDGTYYYYIQDSNLWKYSYFDNLNRMVNTNNNRDENTSDFSKIDEDTNVFCNQVFYYNQFLYMIGIDNQNDLYLFQISKDGSVRERIQKLYSSLDKFTNIEFILHRGYIYFTVTSYETNVNCLYRKKIGDSNSLQLLYTLEGISELYRITSYGFNIYFQEIVYSEDYKICSSAIKSYNIIDNSIATVIEDVYMDYAVDRNIVYYLDSCKLYKYNSDKHSTEVLYNINQKCRLSYDGEYLYLDNSFGVDIEEINIEDQEVTVLNIHGDVIHKISTSQYGYCYFGYNDILILDYAAYVKHKFVILDKNDEYNVRFKYKEGV